MRMNISIPDDLRAEMDRHDGVVWSAIAAAAFREHVIKLNCKEDVMESVVARLSASKAAHLKEMFAEGQEEGRSWASECAEYSELRKLAKWRQDAERSENEEPWLEEFMQETGYEVEDSWSLDDPEFCKGFINGALALVWEALGDRL